LRLGFSLSFENLSNGMDFLQNNVFATEGGVYGKSWQPINQKYAKKKAENTLGVECWSEQAARRAGAYVQLVTTRSFGTTPRMKTEITTECTTRKEPENYHNV
jgi:hypothetical protein